MIGMSRRTGTIFIHSDRNHDVSIIPRAPMTIKRIAPKKKTAVFERLIFAISARHRAENNVKYLQTARALLKSEPRYGVRR